MQNDFFKSLVQSQFNDLGNTMYGKNSEDFLTWFREKEYDKVMPINPASIDRGKLYFILYDLAGKSSKMEKYNPTFVIDWATIDRKRYLFVVNFNFIPIAVRVMVFNTIFNTDLKKFDDLDPSPDKQEAISGITFGKVYKLLKSVGFEWAIRKFEAAKLNKTYVINFDKAKEFITMSTARLTGVDDAKLLEIWKKKITQQDAREAKLIKELLGDYKSMEKELGKSMTDITAQEETLYQSLEFLRRL